jgi:hypothetical protein
MDESVEERVIEEVKEEIIHIVPAPAPVTAPVTAPIQTPIPIPAPIQREPVTLSYDEKSRPLEEELININIDDFDNDDKPLELLPDLLSEDDLHITEYN